MTTNAKPRKRPAKAAALDKSAPAGTPREVSEILTEPKKTPVAA
jgi:hypothetical protein